MSESRKGRFLGVTVRTLLGLGILLVLVNENAAHVNTFVRALINAWGEAQTRSEMGVIAAALEAEYASRHQYPVPDALTGFVRKWIPPRRGNDPAADYWGVAYRLDSESTSTLLRSCGPDRECGSADDVLRTIGFSAP